MVASSRSRNLRTALLASCATVPLLGGPAWAVDFNVADEAQLRSAITSASSGDRIVFQSNITLTADLPLVQTNVAIVGNNSVLSGNNQFRGLLIGAFSGSTQVPVNVSIQDLTITNTKAAGGAGGAGFIGGGGGAGLGGALFVANQAAVTVSNVSLIGNAAVGGNGGSGGGTGAGGGGGMGGNGGNGAAGNVYGGGGGLGVGADGGSNAANGQPGIATDSNSTYTVCAISASLLLRCTISIGLPGLLGTTLISMSKAPRHALEPRARCCASSDTPVW